ncbi:vanillin dehydrogenase [Penicillium cataractarum]|uniref:Vanillin dehydrogenase n=1 Tax=Penicillium cataractarum TaxID=2100454 RepID=A0A9W9RQ16_9EURO|nr:vanillin dehydrogenase [Penicillium cataractarum]KAJ5364011.1 vanillin dehydrogenase [Penicillium cataractarum]
MTMISLIIDGKDVTSDNYFHIHNPSSGKLVIPCTSAGVEEATQAVEAAKAAFLAWSNTKPCDRRDILLQAAEIMLSRKEELIRYQMDDAGAGRLFAEKNLLLAVKFIKDFAGKITSIEGVVPPTAYKGLPILDQEKNAPYILGTRSILLPLGAGNTTILKGSELAPRCFWAIGDVFRQAGLPAGCLNVLYHRTSDAAEVTHALIAHPAVRKITFTGSTLVDSIIAATAGKYTKPVLLELGGKASAIVLNDANLETAVAGIKMGAFLNSGQICMSTERIVVQRAVVEDFRKVLFKCREIDYGKDSVPLVLAQEAAAEKNRRLVQTPSPKERTSFSEGGGATMKPLVVEGVTKDMDLYWTESFGPTVSLIVVDTEEEAIEVANDTEYGLTSAIFTRDLLRGIQVGRRIESGIYLWCGSAVHINTLTVRDEPVYPHGGWKSSGFGRFGGNSAYDEFLQFKTITWSEKR